eukprot:2642648-Rhodomonas_salina.1
MARVESSSSPRARAAVPCTVVLGPGRGLPRTYPGRDFNLKFKWIPQIWTKPEVSERWREPMLRTAPDFSEAFFFFREKIANKNSLQVTCCNDRLLPGYPRYAGVPGYPSKGLSTTTIASSLKRLSPRPLVLLRTSSSSSIYRWLYWSSLRTPPELRRHHHPRLPLLEGSLS